MLLPLAKSYSRSNSSAFHHNIAINPIKQEVSNKTLCKMKDLFSPIATILVATVSINGAAATGSKKNERRLSNARDFLTELSTSLENPKTATLSDGDWASQLSCTADISSQQPTLNTEDACKSTKDANEAQCLWCDASAVIGSGLCVSVDQKAIVGQYWDQLCANSSSSNTPDHKPDPPVPVPVVPKTPNPTSPPTPNPTEPAPGPAPGPGPDTPDALKCSIDSSQQLISDEATCVAMDDPTVTDGEKGVWCNLPILGGSCVTNSMKSSVSFLCGSEKDEGEATKMNNLRGGEGNTNSNKNNKLEGWKGLDPSCVTDNGSGLAGDKDACAAKADSNGQPCIWCNAGNDVFGVCATVSQKDYIGGYMDCGSDVATAEEDTSPLMAVE